jgi:hypothetical protein
MFKSRTLLIFLLALAFLLRSAAALSMQVDMAFAVNKAAAMQNAAPPCHTDSSTADTSDRTSSTACELCCTPIVLPGNIALQLATPHYIAPVAVLFNSLPADAQRPAKPPLV